VYRGGCSTSQGAGRVQGRVLDEPDKLGGFAARDGSGARCHGGERFLVVDEALADAPLDRWRTRSVTYLGVIGAFLTAVAWATYCDRLEESRKKRAWAKAIVTRRTPFHG
jgi:hypothetical protein